MTKGTYTVAWKGKIHGHDVYVEGKGWEYRPLPKESPWNDVATTPLYVVNALCREPGVEVLGNTDKRTGS